MSYDSPQFRKKFLEHLNKSDWKVCVSEMGMGVGFTDLLLGQAGASNTVLYQECRYSEEFQPKDLKSVSEQMVEQLNAPLKEQLKAKGLDSPTVLVTISGAHKWPDERGETHAWIRLEDAKTGRFASLHCWLDSDTERADAGRLVALVTAWFLDWWLFCPLPWIQWQKYCPLQAADGGIDVVRSAKLTMADYLCLVTPKNPLFLTSGQGRLERAAGALRDISTVFRGSFNPVTSSHRTLYGWSRPCLMELSMSNARKSTAAPRDYLHRIEMLKLLKVPILVTTGCPLFTDLHNMMRDRVGSEAPFRYVLGPDTWKALFDPQYIPDKGVFGELMAEAQFCLGINDGEDMYEVPAEWKGSVKLHYLRDPGWARSSQVRESVREGLPIRELDPDVLAYIWKNKLYVD